MKRRVVVTGMGAVTPLANNLPDTWAALLQGKSGVGPITRFDAEDLSTRFMADLNDFDPLVAMTSKEVKRFDDFIHYGVAAAKEAYDDSGLADADIDDTRFGVSIGSGVGGLEWINKNHEALQEGGPRKVSPFFIPGSIINMVPGLVAMKHGCKGPNISIVTACTTGTHSIGHAARMVSYGDADIMLAGGAEAIAKLSVAGFAAARALSKRNDDPEKASRPFDIDRDGFVMGIGAGVMVLEEYEHAKARGATIYAELSGFGMSDDAFHMTAPDPEAGGAMRSMGHAIKDAGLSPSDIDYINAHGTSTAANDKTEGTAICKLFGDHAKNLLVSSTKSMTGHMLGAAGAVEAIFSVKALCDQIVPPTINLDNPDPECGDLDFVPYTAREHKLNVVLSNSFGFGGTNGTLIFTKS